MKPSWILYLIEIIITLLVQMCYSHNNQCRVFFPCPRRVRQSGRCESPSSPSLETRPVWFIAPKGHPRCLLESLPPRRLRSLSHCSPYFKNRETILDSYPKGTILTCSQMARIESFLPPRYGGIFPPRSYVQGLALE